MSAGDSKYIALALCLLVACASAPKSPPPAPLPKPFVPPPAPEPPETAKRAQPPGEAWLTKPAPHGLELGTDGLDAVARKLNSELDLKACRKNTAHWSRPDAGKLKGNYTCTVEHPAIEGAQRLELSFVDLGDELIVLDAFSIAFDPAEWEARIAALEAEHGRADESFALPASTRAWSWGRVEIQLQRTPNKPQAWLRYLDRHAAHRYLARAIKTKKVPRVVPQPKTIPPVEPFGLLFAQDDEAEARNKLEAAGFTSIDCRTLAEHPHNGRVLDCTLTGTPLTGLRSARIQLVDIGDGQLRLALLEHSFDPARFSRQYGELESQYGAVEHESLGAESQAAWWIDPVQISMLGNTSMLIVSYRHGRLAQIAANLIARSNHRRP
jgi:hypothetical protein